MLRHLLGCRRMAPALEGRIKRKSWQDIKSSYITEMLPGSTLAAQGLESALEQMEGEATEMAQLLSEDSGNVGRLRRRRQLPSGNNDGNREGVRWGTAEAKMIADARKAEREFLARHPHLADDNEEIGDWQAVSLSEPSMATIPAVTDREALAHRLPGTLAEMPVASDEVMNPVTRQRARRRVRTQALVQVRYVAQFLLCGSREGRKALLDGIEVQIEGVDSESSRSPHTVYYSLRSWQGEDIEAVQRRMDNLAPILQRQIADKLGIGLCPSLVFVPVGHTEEERRMLRRSRGKARDMAIDLQKNFTREMNWRRIRTN
ncbi:hypothetical protein FOL47_003532 [Perkinsus chesapeaki]|uniref:Uncharacterized protein n=1 Tax=Perkinsus chesapeaki TaxID=330153 RepID=A0A7J6N1Z2_PERCH|nr:hypothetical protein FOL47_003532 [Perkinsus chesapeaki]